MEVIRYSDEGGICLALTHKKLAYMYGILAALSFALGLVFAIQLDQQSNEHLPNIIKYLSNPIYLAWLPGIIWYITNRYINAAVIANNQYSLWVPGILGFAIIIFLYMIALPFLTDRYGNSALETLMIAQRHIFTRISFGTFCGVTTWHILCYGAIRPSSESNDE